MPSSNHTNQSFPLNIQGRDEVIEWDQSGDMQYTSVSPHSPGVLLSGDCIVRAVFSPQHFGITGFTEDFVTDALKKGLSCQRVVSNSESFPQDIHDYFIRVSSNLSASSGKPRKYLGFLTTRVGALRALAYNLDDPFVRSHRARVYDTALERNVGHCDVFLSDIAANESQSKKLIKSEIRSRLFAIFCDGYFYRSPAVAESDSDLIHLQSMLV